MAAAQVTRGCLRRIWEGENVGPVVVQVLESKRVGNGDRVRLDVTDLEHSAKAMVGTQWSDFAANQTPPGSIVRLTNHVMNLVTGKRVFIVLSFDLIGKAPVPTHPIARLERGPPQPNQQSQTYHNQPGGVPAAQPQQGQNTNQPPNTGHGTTGGYGNQQAAGGPPPPAVQSSHRQGNVPSAQASFGGYGQPMQGGGYGGGQGGYGAPRPQGGYGGNANFGGYGARQNQAQPQTGGYGAQTGGYGGGQGGYGAPRTQGGGYGGGQEGGQNRTGGDGRGGTGGGGYGSSSTVSRPRYNTNQGPVARNEAPAGITPISHLSPYMNRWTIMGRCTFKAPIRRYSNSKGEGSVFSFELLDRDGGEIRVTGFNREVDEFEPMVELGKLYTLTSATVKHKRGQYNQTNHDFELTLGQMSKIEPVVEDAYTQEIPHVQYQFKAIMDVQQMEKGTLMDVMGVVESIQPWVMITLKNGSETAKRSLMIRDKSNCDIELTLWGEAQAGEIGDKIQQAVDSGSSPIVSVKSVRVGDFNGKNLSTISASRIEVDCDHPEVAELRQWYMGGGKDMQANSLSNNRMSGKSSKRITVGDIPSQLNNSDGKPVYVEVVAPVTFIRTENMYYPACQKMNGDRVCRKKLREENEQWYCDRCDAHSEPDWRYLLSIAVKDHTGMQYLTAFGDEGTQIIGKPAVVLRDLEGTDELSAAIGEAMFVKRRFVLKIFEDHYNDETRVKTVIVRQEEFNPVKESQNLLAEIHQYISGAATMNANPSLGGASQMGGGMPFSTNPGYQASNNQGGGGGWGHTFAR